AMTKAAIYHELATTTGLSKRQVSDVFDALTGLIKKQLGKKGTGIFTMPGLLKLTRKATPAKPARMGKNPQTGAPVQIKAKPAGVTVRARALKALKDMVK